MTRVEHFTAFELHPAQLQPSLCLLSSQSLEVLVQSGLNLTPQTHHLRVTERDDLTGNHASQTLLSVTPPEQIRQSGPPTSTLAVQCTWLEVQEERQAPTLRDFMWLGVKLGQSVAILWFWWIDRGTSKVWHIRNLIAEHLIHGFLLQDSLTRGLVDTVVEKHTNNLRILVRSRETAGSSGLEDCILLFLCLRDERCTGKVSIDSTLEFPIVGGARVHPRQLTLHVVGREEVYVRKVHRLENVLLEVVIEGQAGGAFDQDAGPVDVDAVFPSGTGLVDEVLRKIFAFEAGELIETGGSVEVVESRVEERVTEASCQNSLVKSSRTRYVFGLLEPV